MKYQTNYIIEPEVFQHCLSEPMAPAHNASNQLWGEYILELKRYGNDCEGKVRGGKEWTQQKLTEEKDNDSSANQPTNSEDQWWNPFD